MQGFPVNEFPCPNVESVLVVPILPNSVILHDILDPFPEVPCDECVVHPYSETLKGKNKMNVRCFSSSWCPLTCMNFHLILVLLMIVHIDCIKS